MPRRGENIHKRRDGRWEGRYIRNRNENGKAVYRSVYGKSYGEVKEKLKIAVTLTEAVKKTDKTVTFQEILKLWLDTNRVRYKGATIARYNYLIERHIIPGLGNIPISQMTTAMINHFLEHKLQEGRIDGKGALSPTYVRSMTLLINSAMNYAINEEFCCRLKTPIYKPTPNKKELPVLSTDEYVRLKEYCLKHLGTTELGILITLTAGLRIGEICTLRWSDIDVSQGIISVKSTVSRVEGNEKKYALIIDRPKTKASVRVIPVSSALCDILEKLKADDSFYVISGENTFISPRTFEDRYHRVLCKSGICRINYHALRHTFATKCIEMGMDVKSLSEILGHSSVNITLDTYVHSSMELKRRQLEKLTRFYDDYCHHSGQ